MSLITNLALRNFRLFSALEVEFSPGINLVHGANGTGKTSILEAIFLAGRGRSFRHHQSRPLIREGSESLMAVVQTEDPCGVIGVELTKTDIRIRVDSRDLKKRSELLHRFPVQLLTPQSHHLVESGPKARRIFLDFGLFHVEPGFHRLFLDYERLLRQRNAQLASKQARFYVFDPQLIETGEQLAESRRRYGARLEHQVKTILNTLMPDQEISFRYRSGWSSSKSFSDALGEALSSDKKLGYTTVGPQRGGMEIWTKLGLASKVLSRGQQKLLVFGLVLAQANIMAKDTDRQPILLIDDLSAELDRSNQVRLLALIATLPMQVVLTNTEIVADWSSHLAHRFHVEQ